MEPIKVVAVGWYVLRDLEVAKILSEVERHMEGLTHGINETMAYQLPL